MMSYAWVRISRVNAPTIDVSQSRVEWIRISFEAMAWPGASGRDPQASYRSSPPVMLRSAITLLIRVSILVLGPITMIEPSKRRLRGRRSRGVTARSSFGPILVTRRPRGQSSPACGGQAPIDPPRLGRSRVPDEGVPLVSAARSRRHNEAGREAPRNLRLHREGRGGAGDGRPRPGAELDGGCPGGLSRGCGQRPAAGRRGAPAPSAGVHALPLPAPRSGNDAPRHRRADPRGGLRQEA